MCLKDEETVKEIIKEYLISLPVEERDNGFKEVLYLYMKELKQIKYKNELEAACRDDDSCITSTMTREYCEKILISLLDKFIEGRILAITPQPMKTDDKIVYKRRKTINNPCHYGNLIEFPKTEEQLAMFSKIFEDSIFSKLTPRQRRKFIDCLAPRHTEINEKFIRKGEDGSKLFFLEKGTFCLLLDEEDFKKEIYRSEIRPVNYITYENKPMVEIELPLHTVIGELALLHGIPRTATIISKTNGLVWFLKRSVYYTIKLHDEEVKWTSFLNEMKNKERANMSIQGTIGLFFNPDTSVRLTQCPGCHKFVRHCCEFSKRCKNFPTEPTHIFFSSFEGEIFVDGDGVRFVKQYELIRDHFTALSEMEGYIIPIHVMKSK